MNKYILAALCCSIICAGAHALTVDSKPGELSSLVSDPAAVTELTLAGTVDASDIFFIADSMPALKSLNLSSASIAGYSGKKIGTSSVYAPGTIPTGAFAGNGITSLVLPAGVKVGDMAFASTALTTLTLPDGVTLGDGAFADCRSLTGITLNNTTLGVHSFTSCKALAKVELGGSTVIADGSFSNCSALATVSGADKVVSIGDKAFSGCSALTTFDFGKQLVSIGDQAFASSGLESANMQRCSALRSIGSWAFASDKNLETVSLPDDAVLGQGVFFECTALKNVNIPENIISVPEYALKGNTAMESIAIPEGIGTIGAYSMTGASGIETVSIPSTITEIGDGAMEGMTNLSKISAGTLAEVPQTGRDVWKGVNQANVRLEVNKGAKPLFEVADQWKDFNIAIVTNVQAPSVEVPQVKVRGRFDGTVLMLEATGDDITTVELFDLAGALLHRSFHSDISVDIDTSNIDTNLMLVRCTLATGSTASLKMAR